MGKNRLLMMMGGSGTRFGADIPKQYIEIDDVPVFVYIVGKYARMKEIDDIVIVSHKDWIDFVKNWVKRLDVKVPWKVTAGGDTRSESVFNGLKAMKDSAEPYDVVLIHDATHPYVDVQGTREVIDAVNEFGGATLGAFQYDTVYQMDERHFIEKVVPRQKIVSGASPEAFRFGDIYEIYSTSTAEEFEKMTSAGAIALARGIDMKVIQADVINLKITYKNDMEVFKKLVKTYFFEE